MGRAAEVTEAREVRVGGSKREGQRGQRCVVQRLQSGDGREFSASGSPVLGPFCAPGGDGRQRHGLLWTGSSRAVAEADAEAVVAPFVGVRMTEGSMSSHHLPRGVPSRWRAVRRTLARANAAHQLAKLFKLCAGGLDFVQGGMQRVEQGWRCRRRRQHIGAGTRRGRNRSSVCVCGVPVVTLDHLSGSR